MEISLNMYYNDARCLKPGNVGVLKGEVLGLGEQKLCGLYSVGE